MELRTFFKLIPTIFGVLTCLCSTLFIFAVVSAGYQQVGECLQINMPLGLGTVPLCRQAPISQPTQTTLMQPPITEPTLPQPTNMTSPVIIFTDTPSVNDVFTETPAPIITTISSTPITETTAMISFSDSANPNNLNPILGWQPGSSIGNNYDLEINPGELTLIAGANTDQKREINTLPLVIYTITGNFEAQVRVYCIPTGNVQFAGIGVRSTSNSSTWARTLRGYYNGQVVGVNVDQNGQESFGNGIPYSNDIVYLKIVRNKSLVTFSYSTNGVNWVVSAKNIVAELPEDVEIYLYAFSAYNNSGFVAQFKDFSVTKK
jgi:hypothetical protein